MEYLSLKEIISLKNDIIIELELLLSNKAAVTKPNSLQWLFFVDCVNVLFNPNSYSKFHSLTNSNKAQLKYEKEILNVLSRHKERGWVLTNPMNPSTKRILSIKVKDIEKKEIFVSTTEYWYLRWWDSRKKTYAFPYRETNHQQYVLRIDDGIWKVYETIRPAPRTSIPHRRRYNN